MHTRAHEQSNISLSYVSSALFAARAALLLKVMQKGIDYKKGLTLNSPPKGCKNKQTKKKAQHGHVDPATLSFY